MAGSGLNWNLGPLVMGLVILFPIGEFLRFYGPCYSGGRPARVAESAQLTPLSAADCLGLKPLAGHSLEAPPKGDLEGRGRWRLWLQHGVRGKGTH